MVKNTVYIILTIVLLGCETSDIDKFYLNTLNPLKKGILTHTVLLEYQCYPEKDICGTPKDYFVCLVIDSIKLCDRCNIEFYNESMDKKIINLQKLDRIISLHDFLKNYAESNSNKKPNILDYEGAKNFNDTLSIAIINSHILILTYDSLSPIKIFCK